jgi:hypothetical protein
MATVVEMTSNLTSCIKGLVGVLLLVLVSAPIASAEDPIEAAIAALQECLHNGNADLCYSEIWGVADALCSPTSDTCFVCIDFIPFGIGIPKITQLAGSSPAEGVYAKWFGYNYRGPDYPVEPGHWQIRSSKSQGIQCGAN